MNYFIGLFCFLFLAAFTSQTLVDICDTLIVGTAFYLIIKNKDFTFLKPILKTWWFWSTWLLVIFLGLYLNSQEFPWLYFLEFRWFLSFFAMIYILTQIKNSPDLIKSICITILFLNLTALTLYFVRQDERAGGIYNGVMAFSQNMGIVVCFFVTYLTCVFKYQLKLSALYKKLLFTVALSSVILVLLTMTRGVWLAAIVGISVSAFFIPKRVFAYTLAGIIILFSSVTYLSSTFKDRIYSRTDGSQTSNSQRKNLWKANTSIFLDYPILGTGYSLNNSRLTEYYKKLNIQDDGFRSHAHNQYLHFAAGTGILGLLFYLFFIGSIFKAALNGYLQSNDNHIKSIYLSLLSSFISFLIAGLTESNFSISKNRLLFLFLCSFIISIGIKSKMIKNS